MIFKGDGSLDALFSRLSERLNLFWTSHMSGYLLKPIRDNKEFKGAGRKIKKGQNGKKGDSQRIQQSLHTFFRVMGETHSVLDPSNVRVTYRINKRQ